MKLSTKSLLLFAGGLPLASFFHQGAMAQETEKPNLLFVFTDQHRKQALGFMGEDQVITPNLDAFAAQSMVFTNAVSNVPVSTPFRGLFLTGMYPIDNGMTVNCSDVRPGLELPASHVTFGNVLKDNNYQTGYIGKWHLTDPTDRDQYLDYDPDDGRGWDTYTPPGPERQGFDFWHAYNSYGLHLEPHYWENTTELIEPNEWSVKHETDVAIDFIEARKDNGPFALFVSMLPPHPPSATVPEEYKELYKDKTFAELLDRPNYKNTTDAEEMVNDYFAAISGIDYNFGRLLTYLDEAGLAENTIVIFTADHGEMLGSQGKMHKSTFYEESSGIPFIIRWTNEVPVKQEDMLLGAIDFMPSILSLMDLPIPQSVVGKNQSWAFKGEAGERPTSTFINSYQGSPLETNPSNPNWRDKGGYRGIKTDRYTYIHARGTDGTDDIFLFDNQEDPYQMNEISLGTDGYDQLFETLAAELKLWLTDMNDVWLDYVSPVPEILTEIYNGDFEKGSFEGWDGYNQKIETSIVKDGDYSGRLPANAASFFQVIKVLPRRTYLHSFDAKFEVATASMNAVVKDTGDGDIKILTVPVTGSTWTHYSNEAIIPDGMEEVKVTFWKGDNGSLFYLDNVSFSLVEYTENNIISTQYGQIDEENSTIENISDNIVANDFVDGLELPEGATVEVIGTDGSAVSDPANTAINNGMKIVVSAENGDTKEYLVSVLVGIYSSEIEFMKINPNPAREFFILNLPQHKDLTIKILDISGKIVYHKKINATSTVITTSSWKSGIYFVNALENDNLLQTKKLIVR